MIIFSQNQGRNNKNNHSLSLFSVIHVCLQRESFPAAVYSPTNTCQPADFWHDFRTFIVFGETRGFPVQLSDKRGRRDRADSCGL